MTRPTKRDFAAISLAEHLLRDAPTTPFVFLGPVVWDIPPGSDTRRWYFIAGCVIADRPRYDMVTTKGPRKAAERTRADLMLELINRPPAVIHDFDDELGMARFFDAICPSEKTRSVREAIERDRADPEVQP